MAKVITSNPKYYPLDWDVCTPEMVIPKINYYKQRLDGSTLGSRWRRAGIRIGRKEVLEEA